MIDGLSKGQLHPFTLLVGITLSDAPEPMMGNLIVFPSSVNAVLASLRQAATLAGPVAAPDNPDKNAAAAAIAVAYAQLPVPDVGKPYQVLAQAGDVVFAHQKLAHRGGPNFSPHIRYQVYFRLKHVEYDRMAASGALLQDAWIGFDGMQHVVQRERALGSTVHALIDVAASAPPVSHPQQQFYPSLFEQKSEK